MSGRLRYLYRAYRYRYRVDSAEMRFMSDCLRPGDLAVDVGCFKGAYTYWMRRAVGATGSVVAFEPQPEQVAYIRRMIGAMKWQNVRVEGQGVSNAVGELTLLRPASGHEATFVARKADEQACERIAVPVTTLDTHFAAAVPGPRFIKIDVEGHELEVLEGARHTLEAHRPALLIECETRHRPDGNVRPVFDFLLSRGYEGTFFLGHERLPLTQFRAEEHQRLRPDGTLPRDYANNFAFEHPVARQKLA
jgi:FkbM family methyltransferase